MFIYYLIVCLYYLAFFRLPVPSIVLDVIFLPLIIYPIIRYKRMVDLYLNGSKPMIWIWLIYLIYTVFLLLSSEYSMSKVTSILNIRGAYPLVLFFVTILVIDSKAKLLRFSKFLLFASVVASLFAIAQSIHGLEPMFDPKQFYHIGHWAGQGDTMIGPIARVILPTAYLVYIVFIILFLLIILFDYFKLLIYFVLSITTIIIGFTRSIWLSFAIAFIAVIVLLTFRKLLSLKRKFRIILTSIIFILALFFAFSFENKITASVSERFDAMFTDVAENSGTYNIRVENSAIFMAIWLKDGYYTGVDIFYDALNETPELTDVGYIYVLVTSGIIGMIIFALTWIVGLYYSNKLISKGKWSKNSGLLLVGTSYFSIIIFFIVSQIYTQFSFSTSLYAIVSGLAFAAGKIFKDEKTIKKQIFKKLLHTHKR